MTHKKSNGRSIPYADEDEGPWTEPVTLGVYRINFNGGLPLRKTSDRDSQVLDVLERGRHFEVLETSVKEDRVRARCLVPPPPISQGNSSNGEEKERHRSAGYQNGYISLANAVSGSTGVSPVPLGRSVIKCVTKLWIMSHWILVDFANFCVLFFVSCTCHTQRFFFVSSI
mmetsp:Transcript_3661/g.7771  ORF Transcript_3661/g.7771 Transcript_3661/m.7771 type:complete len:171 (-) Transcript_3661:865-1377(-)